jgi:methionyl aminopeptidase
MLQLKSMREIGLMRQAGLAVWKAHQIASKMFVPGCTTIQVDREVDRYFESVAVLPLFKNYPNPSKGRPPFPASTCMSVNEEVVHGIPSERKLVEGDIVSMDTGCRLNGWCGDAAVTYPIGRVSSQVQQLLDVTQGVLDLAIELMGHKSRWSEVAVQMAQYVRDHNFSTVECFVGHGVGREMHEEPQVPNFLSRSLRGNGDFAIEPGLVIAVEPMVNLGTKRVRVMPDHWTQVTADGKPSAHFEHTIAITAEGPLALTAAPTAAEEASLAV